MKIVRVYARMGVGGAENHVLALLEGIPGTDMVVYGAEGVQSPRARAAADRYTALTPPDLLGLVEAMRGADLVHHHAINPDRFVALAAQLAGVPLIVQTVHNNIEAPACRLVDRSFVVGEETRGFLETPARTAFLPEGVPIPEAAPTRRADGPLRIVEVRRPDKPMSWTLEQLLAAGALAKVPYVATVVGVDGVSEVPGVRRVGLVADAAPYLRDADLVVHGASTETFGRTPWEGLAHGASAVVTPLRTFERLGVYATVAADHTVAAGVSALDRAARAWRRMRPKQQQAGRVAAWNWARRHASIAGMVAAQREGYRGITPIVRSFRSEDVPDLPALSAAFRTLSAGRVATGGLSPGARAVLLWWVVDHLLVPDDQRIPLLHHALEALGERPALLMSLGRAARHRGIDDLAMAAWTEVSRQFPELVTSYLERAEHHIRQGDRDAARAAFEALLVHTPDHTLARRGVAAMGRAVQGPSLRRFAPLRNFKRIIVTGPHRSGTTIAAEMIAADTGHTPVLEEEFQFYREDLLRGVLRRENIVVQCPALFDLLPTFSDSDTAIVMMRRPLEELAASRDRMFVPGSGAQLSAEEQNRVQLARLGAEEGDAAALKYARWEAWVAEGRIDHPIELSYASLASHPMWVRPEDRRKLGAQWHNRRTAL